MLIIQYIAEYPEIWLYDNPIQRNIQKYGVFKFKPAEYPKIWLF